MSSRGVLSKESILRFLLEEEDASVLDDSSGSELEDNVELDDVESDHVDDYSDSVDNSLNTQDQYSLVSLDRSLESRSPSVQLSKNNPCILSFSRSNIRSRSRHTWATSKGSSSKRASSINIVRVARGPARSIKNITDPLALFEHFMTDQMLEEIVKWTNSEITIRKENYEQAKFSQSETSKFEIRALIGILVLTAALKDNHLTLNELFNIEYSGTRYISCMSKERCDFLLRCLRFDDKILRLQKQTEAPFIPIRII